MPEITSRQRIARTLRREPVDRVGAHESFWDDTQRGWAADGHVREDESLEDHFGLDLRLRWPLKMVADLDFEEEILEEDDERKLVRTGTGAVLRWWKERSGTPEHVDFLVKDRAAWNEFARPRLTDDSVYRRRIDFEGYREVREKCRRENLFFCWGGVNVFELIHPVCGHEYMLMGMALDPGWVVDMCNVYADLTVNLLEILFAEEGPPRRLLLLRGHGVQGQTVHVAGHV